jgi:Family of unknown function (DUF6636)
MRIVTLITVAVAAAALAAGTATAAGAKSSGFFKTQNGKIYCLWVTSGRAQVVCGIRNGSLKPKPTNKCRVTDPTGGWLNINARGRARIQACSGDAGPFANPAQTKVLAPGRTWSGAGMSCKATASGMTCRNKSKHGFTMTTPGPYKKF